ncbi:hypothetical protein BD410DRAFT_779718 [Rickenella mellea]|uniref:Uncharacterized protein n=1 Tax=Rickenella mellea TaxID=50990 RepID=A0A4R5XF04_9AGAM|nr:hypothetical protein BD410DRAFT_779718 [Rickenella mellea]
MTSQYLASYRSLLRELSKSSISRRQSRSKIATSEVRSMFEEHRHSSEGQRKLLRSVENAVTFLRSQRIHKDLLERYNPTHDMSTEERVKATARRVGLDMPVTGKPE